MRILFLFFLTLTGIYTKPVYAQASVAADSTVHYIRVHFLYGSRPYQKFKDSEKKWFGGVLGGHVGISLDSGRILNFKGGGKNFHVFQNKKDKNSRFVEHDPDGFYRYFGSHPDSVKKVIITIPVTAEQKRIFDSIGAAYLQKTPYDYALFGMRCGAAAYEILAKLGIMKDLTYQRTYMKIFYPQKLRRRLLTVAERNNWSIERQEGTKRRKWEKH